MKNISVFQQIECDFDAARKRNVIISNLPKVYLNFYRLVNFYRLRTFNMNAELDPWNIHLNP